MNNGKLKKLAIRSAFRNELKWMQVPFFQIQTRGNGKHAQVTPPYLGNGYRFFDDFNC